MNVGKLKITLETIVDFVCMNFQFTLFKLAFTDTVKNLFRHSALKPGYFIIHIEMQNLMERYQHDYLSIPTKTIK